MRAVVSLNGVSNASFGRSVARKITFQLLENSGRTQTNLEIARSARFFSGLLEISYHFGKMRSQLFIKVTVEGS